MKQINPFPVAEENFSLCWEYIDKLRRKARRKCVIAKIGKLLSNVFLLFSLIFCTNALIYIHFQGYYHQFLDSLPLFSEVWAYISDLLLRPGDSLTIQIVKLLLLAYGSSVLLFLALAAIITLLYHPLRRAVPEGAYATRAELLSKAAQEAWGKSLKTKISTSFIATLLAIVIACVLLFSFSVFRQDSNAIHAILSVFPTNSEDINIRLYVFISFFVCDFFCTILLSLTRFIYRYQFPYDLMAQAEAAALLAKENPDNRSPEQQRQEALELEKEFAYHKAKTMLHEAALLGDIPAMEHYARHCILAHLNDSARYWLDRAIATGEASPEASRMRRWLRLGLHHKAQYLRPDAAPLSKWQKFLRVLKIIFIVLIRIFALLFLFGSVAILVLLLTDKLEISALTDTLAKLFS